LALGISTWSFRGFARFRARTSSALVSVLHASDPLRSAQNNRLIGFIMFNPPRLLL
jgi:hypothetical protein